MFDLYEQGAPKSLWQNRTSPLDVVFGLGELCGMADAPFTIADLRKELGLTLDAFAVEVGLRSKGQVSEIEKSNRCSPHVALAVEKLSACRIDAGALNPIIQAARTGDQRQRGDGRVQVAA